MERNSPSGLIATEEISKQYLYGARFDYRDLPLETSLEERGILVPLLMKRVEKKSVLVAGHKRLFYARQRKWKKVPAHFISEKFTEKECFLLSVYSNWNQHFSELDRLEVVRKAERTFRFSHEEMRTTLLPALGIPANAGSLEGYRRVAELASEIHTLIHERRIPFRGASSLRRFSRQEQLFLAKSVFKQMHLTTNQLILISEWLSDLKKLKKTILEELFKEKELQVMFLNSKGDPGSRGDRLFEIVRMLRFPRLSEGDKSFRRLKGQIESFEGMRLERPGSSEEEGVLLRARLKDREGVKRVLNFLESHRGALESLL